MRFLVITVMMMGLANGPAIFQEVMSKVQAQVGKDVMVPFLDDMIMTSDTYDNHLRKIRAVLQVLREAGLTIKLSKCRFFMRQVKFLGFMISAEGIQPGKEKLRAVVEFPRPGSEQKIFGFGWIFSKIHQKFRKNRKSYIDATQKSSSVRVERRLRKSLRGIEAEAR